MTSAHLFHFLNNTLSELASAVVHEARRGLQVLKSWFLDQLCSLCENTLSCIYNTHTFPYIYSISIKVEKYIHRKFVFLSRNY